MDLHCKLESEYRQGLFSYFIRFPCDVTPWMPHASLRTDLEDHSPPSQTFSPSHIPLPLKRRTVIKRVCCFMLGKLPRSRNLPRVCGSKTVQECIRVNFSTRHERPNKEPFFRSQRGACIFTAFPVDIADPSIKHLVAFSSAIPSAERREGQRPEPSQARPLFTTQESAPEGVPGSGCSHDQ